MTPQLDAAIIHDIKNRLSILADELAQLNRLALPAAAGRHAAAAQEQSWLLNRKLVEYLTLQKVSDTEGLRAATREDTPALLLDEICADALTLAGGRLAISLNLEAAPDFWFYDRYLVRLALDSAIYNALRFATTRITLGARSEADGLCFFVHDDGAGLQTQPAGSSTGLGLRVCAAVAGAHRNKGRHGRSLLRNAEGGGAVFELHLP